MPAGSGHFQATEDSEAISVASNSNQNLSPTRTTNGHYTAQSRADPVKGSGSVQNSTAATDVAVAKSNNGIGTKKRTRPKTVRDLSEKIDLMPPLSLEHGTKRLILAKKLDRENLEKYLQSSSGSSLTQSSSASLTVHVKCQLKTRHVNHNGPATSDHRLMVNSSGSSLQLDNSADLDISVSLTSSVANKLDKHGQSKAIINSILIPVHLIITDENDNWPVFSTGPYIIDLNETAPVGSLLQNNEILAFDEDQPGPLSTIEYSIVQGSLWSDSFGFLNPLDSRSLIVKDNRLLDYESQSKLMLNVMARDQGDPPNWAITTLYINLIDQDDMNPVFNEDKYHGSIKENRPGERIDLSPRRMVAYDGDKMLSAPITYSFFMKTNESMHFDLDSGTGQLTLKKSFVDPKPTDVTATSADTASFCLLIKAAQLDNPLRWSMTAITIGWSYHNILKTNNMKLKADSRAKTYGFGLANHTVEISELAPVGTTIFTAKANFERDEISYQLLDNELGYLDIDQNSGQLTLKKSLDYEMFRQLSVRILASAKLFDSKENHDRGNSYPRLTCDIVRLNVNVVDSNDHSPEFSHDLYNFQLSISDLIANFEQNSSRSILNRHPSKISRENMILTNVLHQGSNRNGQVFSEEETIDEFGHRAILLGQIYCADRDYGDKVSLQLAGSRANLFHLAQDGRLYLPLINSSNNLNLADQNSSRNQFSNSKAHQSDIAISRVFSNVRRSDEQHHDSRQDRIYLNYLLSEIGNMGLIRLKVHASDNGHPEPKRSTALIVISIISIDNFIIQRSPTLNPIHGSQMNGHGRKSDDTSHGSGIIHGGSTIDATQEEPNGRDVDTMPTMMIPSMNGRSYVHINPDIVGNLLSTTSHMSTASHSQMRTGNSSSLNGNSHAGQFDPLEPLSSNTVTDMLSHRETRLNHADPTNDSKYKPPGLLLVDEDGAKFVAMPTAMEVYNQHVKDANGHQKMKTKFKQQLADSEASSKKSTWQHLGDKFGFENEGGLMRWINISTAIALHLVVIACILSLAVRFKSLLGFSRRYRSSDGGGSDSNFMDSQPDLMSDHNLSDFNRWPKNISNFGSFLADKQSEPATSGISVANYTPTYAVQKINQSSTCAQHESYHDSEFDQHVSVSSEEVSSSKQPDSGARNQTIVSSGILVSAKGKGQFVAKHMKGENDMSEVSPETRCHQQNLFEHLKLTLDKIMDNDNAEENKTTQVVSRSVGHDTDDSISQRDRQLDVCAQLQETNDPKEVDKTGLVVKSSISTFLGASTNRSNTSNQKGVNSLGANENNQSQSVVSINVLGPRTHQGQKQPSTSRNDLNPKNSTSTNSSIVSLVSMSSSSLSNKINAAAGKMGNNGSDSTSLNSSILLQTCDGVASGDSSMSLNKDKRQRKISAKQPPAPPPLPPPPSLIRATVIDRLEDAHNNVTPVGKQIKLAHSQEQKNNLASTERLANAHPIRQPENPAHLRLRRDDQLHSSMNNKIDKNRSNDCQMGVRWCEEDLTNHPNRAKLSVGGRREARYGHSQLAIDRNNQRARASTTKPLKQDDAHHGKQSASPQTSSSNKTVSPTTSVDRGYESFQSFGAQPTGVHFASLPDYPQVCYNYPCDQDVAYLADSSAGRRGARSIGKKQLENRVFRKSMKSNSSKAASRVMSAHSRVRQNTTETRPAGPLRSSGMGDGTIARFDCDTEDDDFHYYCNESVQDDNQHQVGCLSYSNHAYQQQIPLAHQTHQSAPTTINYADQPMDHSSRQATRAARCGSSGGRKVLLYKSDLNNQPSNQLSVATSQICDMMTCEGRRGIQSSRSQQINDGQSSQIGGEVGVKRLTWSDQVY